MAIYSPEQISYSEVDSLGERVQNIPEPQKVVVFVSELPIGKDLTTLVDGFKIKDGKILNKYSGEIDRTLSWRDVDQLVFKISRDSDIADTEKAIFLKKLRVVSNDRLAYRLAGTVNTDFSLGEDIEQPVTSSYLVSTERARRFFQELREIKDTVKIAGHNLIYEGFKEYEKVPLEQIPESSKVIIQKRLKAFNPSDQSESSVEELKKHFEKENLDQEGEILSKLQYLRVLKEMVNFIIAENNESRLLINDIGSSPLRLGERNTEDKIRKTRRHSLLANIHFGQMEVESQSGKGKNILGMEPDIANLIKELKATVKTGSDVDRIKSELTSDTNERIAWLKERNGESITAEDEKMITEKVLSSLGILSNQKDADQQLADYELGIPSVNIHTLSVAVSDKITNNVFISKNNLILIPFYADGNRLDNALMTRIHELTHSLQKLRRDASPVDLMKKMNGLGRHMTLAEMGALHNEYLIQGLLSKRSVYWSDYEYEIFFGFLNGETFTDLIQRAIKPIYDNDEEVKNIPEDQVVEYETIKNGVIVKETVSKKMATTCEVALRRVMRLYKDLGATGDGRNSPVRKYPNTWSMAYILGELPQYTQYPSTLSGVPTHRIEELKDLLPDFSINGEKVTDSMIIRIFIDSAYEVMKDKLDKTAASV